MDHEAKGLSPEFWSVPLVASALASCDFATLLEEIRKAHGWKQSELAKVVGYSQSWVSKVLRGRLPLTIDQVRDISRKLAIPVHLLRFGDLGSDDPTNRRDFGKAMSLALLPIPRRAGVDDTTVATLTAINGSQRRLDATTPARELTRGVVAHLEMANHIYRQAQRWHLAPKIAAAISEAAGFAAWLYADMQDIGTARAYYRQAIDRARRAGDDLLMAYMLGSLAVFEIECDDPLLGLALVKEARKQISRITQATPVAWLASLEALAYASIGPEEERHATDAIRQVERIIEGDVEPPPWPWVFPFDHAKLAGYRAKVAVRLYQPTQALAAFAESLTSVQPAPKQRAAVMLDVATAARQGGQRARDSVQIDEAFRLAREALDLGVTYASERVVHLARRFRRGYKGPTTQRVRDFDDQLRLTLL